MKNNLPKWNERTLLEKIFTCLTLLFGILAIIFILLETFDVNVPNKLDSIFISLELISLGALNYKYNKILSIFIFVVFGISLVLTLANMLIN